MDFFKQQFGDLSWKFWLVTIFVCGLMWWGNIYSNGGILYLIVSLSGILYAFFAGKGKVICFGFGFVYNFTYAYASYQHQLYGDTILNLFFYIPIGILGVYDWLSPKNKKDSKIMIRYMNLTQNIICLIAIALSTPLCMFLLEKIGTRLAVLEAFVVTGSLIAFFLQVNRYVENYILVTLVNIVSVYIWLKVQNTDPQSLVLLLTIIVFLCIGAYYWFVWAKGAQRSSN